MALSSPTATVAARDSERTVAVARSLPVARPVWAGWTNAPSRRRPITAVLKRLLDVVGASALLIVCAPLFAVVAIAVRLDSSGPVFFGQTRVGRDLQLLRIWKFRSMRNGAEDEHPAIDHTAV